MTERLAVANHAGHQVAKGLAVFSLVLGASELIWAGAFARFLGLQGLEWLIMAYGAREIVAGLGIFATAKYRAGWVWFRVAGDVLDIATVLYVFTLPNPPILNVATALVLLIGATLIDIWCARTLSAQRRMARESTAYSDRSGLPGGQPLHRPH